MLFESIVRPEKQHFPDQNYTLVKDTCGREAGADAGG